MPASPFTLLDYADSIAHAVHLDKLSDALTVLSSGGSAALAALAAKDPELEIGAEIASLVLLAVAAPLLPEAGGAVAIVRALRAAPKIAQYAPKVVQA